MAYTFNGTNQLLKLQNAQPMITNYPLTQFGWAKSSELTTLQVALAYQRNTGTYNGLYSFLNGTGGGDPMSAHNVSSSLSYDDGAWHALAGRSSSSTAHDVVADGTVDSNATTLTFETYYDVLVGARQIPSFGLGLTGAAACVAMWNVTLSDDEMNSLAKGFPPRRIRPQSLRMYAPLIRDLQAWVNKNTTTSSFTNINGATVSDQPRMYGF